MEDQLEVSELAAEVIAPAEIAEEASKTKTEYSKYGDLPAADYPTYSYKTNGGKTINIKHDEWGTFWFIEFSPGGQLPAELQGRFTNDKEAKHIVELYLAKQDD